MRLGADLARDREIFRALNRTLVGRQAFILLLVAIAEPGPLATNDAAATAAIDNSDLSQFLY